MEQQLYLLRHAEAEPWSPLGNDFSRPLSDAGKRHAQALADWAVVNLDLPDTVLCSPSKRTRETLAPLLAKWPQLLSTTEYADPIYGASLDMLLTMAGDAFTYSQRLLVVGHNPGVDSLLGKAANCENSNRSMATGTLAVITFEQGFTSSAKGRLSRLLNRGDLPV